MKSSLLLVVLLFSAVFAFTEHEYKTTFADWIHKHSKMYTAEEFQGRYATFKSNMDFVLQWNADTTHTHTVELNALADISNAEFQRLYLGTRFDGTERLMNAGTPQTFNVQADVVNWVDKGAVTPIKNQLECGSCWAFSTTGSVEGIHQIKTGELVSLSEQNLMDCSNDYGNEGCDGGLMDNAFRYIIANHGIDLESDYPYLAKDGTCRFSTEWIGAQISSYADVQSGNENALANAVNGQPVSVAIDASHSSFQLYQSGIYSEPACSATALDHGVLAVGYGSDNGDYWLVKNSWGTAWGMQGYIWMARNANNMCGIATMASIPIM